MSVVIIGGHERMENRYKEICGILAVGIAYDRKDLNKKHVCKVEVLREKL